VIVIYGEYPPSPGPAAEATLELVRAHLADVGLELDPGVMPGHAFHVPSYASALISV